MPQNIPVPHEPEVWTDRLFSHAEVLVALMTGIAGIGISLEALVGTSHLVLIPEWLAVLLGLTIAVSGFIAVAGVLHPQLRHIEQHGWHLLITSCVFLSVTMYYTHPYTLISWFTLIPVMVGLVRAIALSMIRKASQRISDATSKDKSV